MSLKKDNKQSVAHIRLMIALSLTAVVSMGLLVVRILISDSTRFAFMPWNLFLGLVSLLLAWWLVIRIRQFGWLKWQQLLLTLLWIAFLPNSFYMITDLIHLRANYEAPLLFDISLLTSFMISGMIYGFMSIYMIQVELMKRFKEISVYSLVMFLFLASSFAICLGRYTRWNSWDILLQPAGLLFDVSDRLINPDDHMLTYQTTLVLFVLLASIYIVIYESARFLRNSR